MNPRLLFGLCGALTGACLPAAFAAAAPPRNICCSGLHGANWAPGRQSPLYIDWVWTPQIDRSAGSVLARSCRTTPSASVELEDAPLPDSFDPRDVPAESLYACILVAPGGGVAAVRLIGRAGSAIEAALTEAIGEEWRFELAGSRAQRVRVRLDAPAGSHLHVRPPPTALF